MARTYQPSFAHNGMAEKRVGDLRGEGHLVRDARDG
jgi:hypothetical protein